MAFLVVYIKPWRICFSCVVVSKGVDPIVVKRLTRWIREFGLLHYVYKSDRAIASRKMFAEATKLAGVNGREYKPEGLAESDPDVAPAAVPEESAPGESQSNGLAEHTMQSVEGQIRCLMFASRPAKRNKTRASIQY